MIKIANKIIPIIFLFSVTSCCLYKFQQPQIKETPILLEIRDSVVTDKQPITKLNIHLTNNSNTTIALLPYLNPMCWKTIVLLNDSIRYDQQILYKLHIPTKNEYIEVEPKKEITLSFDFNISEYERQEPMNREKNKDYGIYKIQIIYEDHFLKHCKSISGPLYSNKVNLFYKNY